MKVETASASSLCKLTAGGPEVFRMGQGVEGTVLLYAVNIIRKEKAFGPGCSREKVTSYKLDSYN